MAYANGSYDDKIIEILKSCGIKYARTVVSTEKFDLPTDWLKLPATCHHNNPKLMQLAKRFVESGKQSYWWSNQAKLFYLCGHSYEFDNNDNWNIIEKFAEYVGGREDVWYATNGEIYNYLQAYDRLEFSMDGTLVYNPSFIDVCIDYFGKKITISAGKNMKL